MGCFNSKENLNLKNYESYSNNIIFEDNKTINLKKGGKVINTSIGNIQFGLPPETIKDSMSINIKIPQYYLVPTQLFDKELGISIAEFEFPAYYNFFINKTKIKLIVDSQQKKRLLKIFRETLLGPVKYDDFEKDFTDDYPYEKLPKIERETKYFAKNPFNLNEELKIDLLIEFIVFNDEGIAKIDDVVIYKYKNSFKIFDENNLICNIEDKININIENYFTSKMFLEEKKEVLKQFYNDSSPVNFKPPYFGITILGSSHGFDACNSTSGFIVWVNHRGIFVDPPPFSNLALKNYGIPASLITKIIISHCHADHDAGSLSKILESGKVDVYTTNTIIKSFIRKYSAYLDFSENDFVKFFNFKKVVIGHKINIHGAEFSFFYSFHSIPTIGFELEFNGKKLYFSSDTFYDPKKLKQINLEENLFRKERMDQITNIDFSKYDIILHEAGVAPIHTPIIVLSGLDKKIKDNFYLIHVSEKDIKEEYGLKFAKPGIKNTWVLIKNFDNDKREFENEMDCICNFDLFSKLPMNRLADLYFIMKKKVYKANELIISEGEIGENFYIILNGICRIFSIYKNLEKFLFYNDYFGESCIIENKIRNSNVEAYTDVIIYEINRNDLILLFDQFQKPNQIDYLKHLSLKRKSVNSDLIYDNDLINNFPETFKCELNSYLREIDLPPDVYIWKKNKIVSFCFFVIKGEFILNAPIDISNLEIKQGTLIGDFDALLDEKTTKSSVKTVENTKVLVLENRVLIDLIEKYPGFGICLKNKYII